MSVKKFSYLGQFIRGLRTPANMGSYIYKTIEHYVQKKKEKKQLCSIGMPEMQTNDVVYGCAHIHAIIFACNLFCLYQP